MSANAYKRLNISDNFVVPYTANKSWDILSSSFAANSITVNVGINTTNSLFDPINEYKTNGQYDRLVYNSVNTSYYPNFLPYQRSTSSRQGSYYNDGTLSTSSYFNGLVDLGNPNTIKFYPTGNGAIIYAINVPRSLTSDRILPTTFEVNFASGSGENQKLYKIYDDGNYNLLYSGSNISSSIGTILSQSSYVGNVFYEQNIAILTVIPDSVRLRGWRGINPVCAQASPSPTPSITPTKTPTPTISVTPSITLTPTPSITKTPSITPTISVTPSVTKSVPVTPTPSKTLPPTVTPTPTISVTPTPSSNTVNITISNISKGDNVGTIKSVALSTGAAFFTYNSFNYGFPLYGIGNYANLPSDLLGTNTAPQTSKIIRVTIGSYPTSFDSGQLILYKNNIAVSTKILTPSVGLVTVNFDAISWTTSDILRITYEFQPSL